MKTVPYSWDALELPEHTLVNIHNAEKELKYKNTYNTYIKSIL